METSTKLEFTTGTADWTLVGSARWIEQPRSPQKRLYQAALTALNDCGESEQPLRDLKSTTRGLSSVHWFALRLALIVCERTLAGLPPPLPLRIMLCVSPDLESHACSAATFLLALAGAVIPTMLFYPEIYRGRDGSLRLSVAAAAQAAESPVIAVLNYDGDVEAPMAQGDVDLSSDDGLLRSVFVVALGEYPAPESEALRFQLTRIQGDPPHESLWLDLLADATRTVMPGYKMVVNNNTRLAAAAFVQLRRSMGEHDPLEWAQALADNVEMMKPWRAVWTQRELTREDYFGAPLPPDQARASRLRAIVKHAMCQSLTEFVESVLSECSARYERFLDGNKDGYVSLAMVRRVAVLPRASRVDPQSQERVLQWVIRVCALALSQTGHTTSPIPVTVDLCVLNCPEDVASVSQQSAGSLVVVTPPEGASLDATKIEMLRLFCSETPPLTAVLVCAYDETTLADAAIGPTMHISDARTVPEGFQLRFPRAPVTAYSALVRSLPSLRRGRAVANRVDIPELIQTNAEFRASLATIVRAGSTADILNDWLDVATDALLMDHADWLSQAGATHASGEIICSCSGYARVFFHWLRCPSGLHFRDDRSGGHT